MKKNFVLLICLFFLIIGDLTAQGRIRANIGRSFSNLNVFPIQEAGADFKGTSETQSNFLRLSISSRWSYRITVRRQDISWDNNLDFYVRRSGNGSGPSYSSVSGGSSYLLLTTFNQTLFTGWYSRSNITFQYKIEGVSTIVPAGDRTTAVVYTITGL